MQNYGRINIYNIMAACRLSFMLLYELIKKLANSLLNQRTSDCYHKFSVDHQHLSDIAIIEIFRHCPKSGEFHHAWYSETNIILLGDEKI